MNIIMKQCNSSGLHSKEKIDELEKRIIEGQREVSELMDDLKTDRGLAAIILFTGEKRQVLEKLIEDLDQEFELNYEFEPRININTDVFEVLSRSIGQLV